MDSEKSINSFEIKKSIGKIFICVTVFFFFFFFFNLLTTKKIFKNVKKIEKISMDSEKSRNARNKSHVAVIFQRILIIALFLQFKNF